MATVLEPSLAPAATPESSDRSFGFVFAAVFAVVAGWPLIRHESPRWWALAIALAFAVLALLAPSVLRPLNRVWLPDRQTLHKVVSLARRCRRSSFSRSRRPAWIMRRRGTDVLSLRRRPDLSSYWIAREPAAPETETMKRQF